MNHCQQARICSLPKPHSVILSYQNFEENMSMTELLRMIFSIQIILMPLLFQYVCNLHCNETRVTVIIYFTRNSGLKIISTDNLIFMQSQVYSFSMLSIPINTLLVLRAQFIYRAILIFTAQEFQTKSIVNCALSHFMSLSPTLHIYP